MAWINGRWVESESGEGLTPGQGMQPGAGFTPGYDPAIGPANEKYPGLDPKYNDFADLYGASNAFVRAKRDKMIADYGGVDAFGPTSAGYNPPGEIAGDVQLQHDIAVQRYNAGLASAAQGYLRQGLDLFQTYRPGGAASLASGMYGQLANATLAGRTDPIDLMHEDRLDEARKARNRQQKAGLIQGAGSILGAVAGSFFGPAGTAVGGSVGGALGGMVGQAVAGGGGQQAYIEPAGGTDQGSGVGEMAGGGGSAAGTMPLGQQKPQTQWTDVQTAPSDAGPGGTLMPLGNQPASGQQGGAQSRPSSAPGSGPGGAPSRPGTMFGGGPSGPFTPSGGGAMAMTNMAVADNYERRYGGAVDTMWATYSSDNMVGFGDRMLGRLDLLMAEDYAAQLPS